MSYIFISYSHKDTEYAHVLAENLQTMGFEVWIDERLDHGVKGRRNQKQLDSCSAFILIMSRDFMPPNGCRVNYSVPSES